jgi:hypothetical protein
LEFSATLSELGERRNRDEAKQDRFSALDPTECLKRDRMRKLVCRMCCDWPPLAHASKPCRATGVDPDG